jgi:hypothetical protein
LIAVRIFTVRSFDLDAAERVDNRHAQLVIEDGATLALGGRRRALRPGLLPLHLLVHHLGRAAGFDTGVI